MYNEASIIADTAKTLSGVMQENLKKAFLKAMRYFFQMTEALIAAEKS